MITLLKRHGLYLAIAVILILVRISPTSTGSVSLDNALNDFSIGGIASTLVAWLIFLQEQHRAKKRNQILRAMIMIPFIKSVVRYMEQFCFQSAFMPPTMRSVKKTFTEWSQFYCKKCEDYSKQEDKNFEPLTAESVMDFVDLIDEQANQILQNQIWICREKSFGN